MGEIDELAEEARKRADDIVGQATLLLDTGADPSRVHRRYFSAALALWEEVEVRALIASGDDSEAMARLRLLVRELESLGAEAQAELEAQAGGGPET